MNCPWDWYAALLVEEGQLMRGKICLHLLQDLNGYLRITPVAGIGFNVRYYPIPDKSRRPLHPLAGCFLPGDGLRYLLFPYGLIGAPRIFPQIVMR